MFCKTIILSNKENLNSNAPRGILSITSEYNEIYGKIRLYNLGILPANSKLGIYIGGEVLVSPLTKRPNHYEFSIDRKIDLTKPMYCAIIDNNTGEKKVLLEGGNASGFSFTDSPADEVIEAKDDELDELISSSINSCEVCSNCEDCEYKKYFYEHFSPATEISADESQANTQPVQQSLDNNVTQPTLASQTADEVLTLDAADNNSQTDTPPTSEDIPSDTFLNDIIYQLDEMFKQYPNDELIMSIIPNSRFIKVATEQTSPYILGVIYEDKIMKYIAYGVPASYNSLPPVDFGQNYQWLPLNPDDIMSDGYFMIYQDATNGQVVNLQIK